MRVLMAKVNMWDFKVLITMFKMINKKYGKIKTKDKITKIRKDKDLWDDIVECLNINFEKNLKKHKTYTYGGCRIQFEWAVASCDYNVQNIKGFNSTLFKTKACALEAGLIGGNLLPTTISTYSIQ